MKQKAFIIDDDHICHFITRHLIISEDLAQEVMCFYQAEEALQRLLSGDSLPEMIFLDLNMPHMNGWQFLDALRPHEARLRSQTRIFILTSSMDPADQEKAWQYASVAGYFLKPLQCGDLQSIRELINAESQ
jgi:CheY-like chemotaxis protein